ncbi:MAG: pantoate--beta-alanine ligase [Xanthomonadales bacterium]|nr:pantoate--beta-alanine ligase [Xanthomonadales bacterium]
MEQIADRRPLRERITGWRAAGQSIALVPTMGNLHQGHLSLVRTARRLADRCVTSIYVNPAQFGEGEDYERYPRTLEEDVEKLAAEGCDAAFVPDSAVLYPFGLEQATRVLAAPGLAGRLEGRFRPGHFDGVVTVVARLFALVQPDVAVFGEKDYQQLLVVRRMARDLGFNIEIFGAPTVRSEAGLALSSRNAYLDNAQVEAALGLNRVLAEIARSVSEGDRAYASLEASASESLQAAGLKVEYVAIRRADNLAPPDTGHAPLRALAAAWCGSTRLIDNIALNSCNQAT